MILEKGNLISFQQYEKEKALILALREEKKERGLKDLFFFAKYILGYEQLEEQPHRGLCDTLISPVKRKLILEPRNSFKSTIATIAFCVWKITKFPEIRILIDSQDLTNSKKFLSEIKGHFETNDEFRMLYGDFVGTK